MTDANRQAIVAYANRTGATVLPDNDQWEFRFEIKSESSSRLYIIARNKLTKLWGCSCPGWKSHRRCKHLQTIKPHLLITDGTKK